jgi:hypothetical protein
LKIILPIPFLEILYNCYKKTRNNIYFILSILVVAIPYGLIIDGNSRNTIIIPLICMMTVFFFLYPEKRRSVMIFVGILIGIISVITILWKSLATLGGSSNSLSFWIAYLESYFAGIANMGKAVVAKINYDSFFSLDILFNDLFQNVPFLSKIVDPIRTSSYYYYDIWGRTDQVIPATGNGLFYFGYLFAPLVPIFILYISAKFTKYVYKSQSIPEILIYSYASVTITYNCFNSISSLMMKLTIFILPTILIIWLNKRVIVKRGMNKNKNKKDII